MALNESIIFSDEQLKNLLELKQILLDEEKLIEKQKEKSKSKHNEKK